MILLACDGVTNCVKTAPPPASRNACTHAPVPVTTDSDLVGVTCRPEIAPRRQEMGRLQFHKAWQNLFESIGAQPMLISVPLL